ncbi:helix-turn-helix transcriptional regulator [Microbacteriaceae bacterium VKM Ac-2854]|nr:helix-turn-helix transcriptional regulator [Microbacteriaceae bacterium VKM Ac-2854]
MSVRDGLLSLLTLGPAYGLQLHGEFLDRAAHRHRLNVGQVYATLDRLRDRELVASAGSTEDGLPLYRLTEAGAAAAHAWLSGAGCTPDEEWDDILDRILIASSLDDADLPTILAAYEAAGVAATVDDHPQRRLASIAESARRSALRTVIEAARTELAEAASGSLARGFAGVRPRRGRRSAAAKPAHPGEVA